MYKIWEILGQKEIFSDHFSFSFCVPFLVSQTLYNWASLIPCSPNRRRAYFWYVSVKNRSPAQVGCMRQALGPGALGGPGGSGCRGRWEGGSGWGRHVNSRTFHFSVWQNSLQIKKKKKIPVKKKKKKEVAWRKRLEHWFMRNMFLSIKTGQYFIFFFISLSQSPSLSLTFSLTFQCGEFVF